MGPNIEPCGIPDKIIWKIFSVSRKTQFSTFQVWMQKGYCILW